MEDSIFTKIIKGEIPCHKIYEDERVLAFLDIHPDEVGHTLLVPKKQIDKIYDLEEKDYNYLWQAAKKIALHYEQTLNLRIMFKVVGVDVPHAHIHIIPYNPVNHPDHASHQNAKMAMKPDQKALEEEAKRIGYD